MGGDGSVVVRGDAQVQSGGKSSQGGAGSVEKEVGRMPLQYDPPYGTKISSPALMEVVARSLAVRVAGWPEKRALGIVLPRAAFA